MLGLRPTLAVLSILLSTLAAAQTEPVAVPSPASPAAAAPAPAGPPASPQAAGTTTPRATSGITLALRGAWLMPHGVVAGIPGTDATPPMSKEFGSGYQFTGEAGYRFSSGLTAAAFLQYGLVTPLSSAGNGACQTSVCDNGRTVKYGVELLYHFLRDRPLSPWVGAGFGYEVTSFDLSNSTGSGNVSYRGWQLLDLQLGVDYAVASSAFLGLFLANSFGQYDQVTVKSGGASTSADIAKKGTHDWFQVGVRVRYDL